MMKSKTHIPTSFPKEPYLKDFQSEDEYKKAYRQYKFKTSLYRVYRLKTASYEDFFEDMAKAAQQLNEIPKEQQEQLFKWLAERLYYDYKNKRGWGYKELSPDNFINEAMHRPDRFRFSNPFHPAFKDKHRKT